MALSTLRLTLIPSSPTHLVALIESAERFEELSGLRAANGFREFFASDDVSPDWLATLRASSEPDPWQFGFFIVHRDEQVIIGSAGFKGPPDGDGVVEIAYGIVPTFEGRGFATEAASGLVQFAYANGHVRLIRAHTLPETNASTRVLEKCRFLKTGLVIDPDDGPVWRWERGR